jgi:putative ABC transport system permease protein
MGLRVISGRWLSDTEPEPVVVINESLARRVFGDADPVGRRLQMPGPRNRPSSVATIVGIVGDLKYSKLDADPGPHVYVPYHHSAGLFRVRALVRTAGSPNGSISLIRATVAGIDKTQAPYDIDTVENILAESIAPRRFNLILLGTFATAALLLALLGIYGVIAYSVAQRTHEIGVRMAVGAQRRHVVQMIVRQGLWTALLGIVAGLGAAAVLMRLMASLLYDVQPGDPTTFAVVAALLVATLFLGCLGPALKAALVDPLMALRTE